MRILPAVLLVLSMPAPFASATTRLEITVLGGSVTAHGGGGAYFETKNATTEAFSFGDGASSAAGHASSAGHVGYGWARASASANHGAANTGTSSGSNASTQSKFVSVTFRIDVHGRPVRKLDQRGLVPCLVGLEGIRGQQRTTTGKPHR